MESYKRCPRCRVLKNAKYDFYKTKSGSVYRVCKECHKKRVKKDGVERLKSFVQGKLSEPCALCGAMDEKLIMVDYDGILKIICWSCGKY